MASLVQYSDSEEDDTTPSIQGQEASLQNGIKRKRSTESSIGSVARKQKESIVADLPPLPSSFHDLYASASRVSTHDDPALHGGRKRVAPHVEGQWATHIYLEWHPSNAEFGMLESILAAFDGHMGGHLGLQSLLCSDLGAHLPLHISLSRPIALLTDQRQSFQDLLEAEINKSGVRPFEVQCSFLDWVSNYEQTRWFLVLRVARPAEDALIRLLRLSNRSALAYGQPPLYAEGSQETGIAPAPRDRPRGNGPQRNVRARRPCSQSSTPKPSVVEEKVSNDAFHISLAWTLERPTAEMMSELKSINDSDRMKDVRGLRIQFLSVKLKIGNAVKDLPLPVRVTEGRGLIGK
ncbi:MAG: hypothetical protein M1823_002008 [Watsoniomyces obsoletus]|nr:MAG: hypothetical protein M1823_002008 [Watsoniomyces obsoletus]